MASAGDPAVILCKLEPEEAAAPTPGGPKWPSVTAMLADLAEGLHAGRPVGGWQPVVDHGRLDWEVAARA
jgi:hypothetical protein